MQRDGCQILSDQFLTERRLPRIVVSLAADLLGSARIRAGGTDRLAGWFGLRSLFPRRSPCRFRFGAGEGKASARAPVPVADFTPSVQHQESDEERHLRPSLVDTLADTRPYLKEEVRHDGNCGINGKGADRRQLGVQPHYERAKVGGRREKDRRSGSFQRLRDSFLD